MALLNKNARQKSEACMIASRPSLDFRTAQATLSPMDTSTSRPHFLSIQEFGAI
jgi:hypothetical protein